MVLKLFFISHIGITCSKVARCRLYALPCLTHTPCFFNGAGHVYVWKSFGDTHTSIPVYPNESERAGRFVGRLQTECGIHTRIAEKGAPHGGKLIDLTVASAKDSPLDRCTHKIELNERQMCDFELLAVGGFSPLTGFMVCVAAI